MGRPTVSIDAIGRSSQTDDAQDVVAVLVLHEECDRALGLDEELVDEHLAFLAGRADECFLADVRGKLVPGHCEDGR
jgi:hypothetical protein